MGTCIYCGKPAGLFRKRHKECQAQHDLAAIKIPEFFVKALESPLSASRFHELALDVARSHFIGKSEFQALSIEGLGKLIDTALDNKVLTEGEDARARQLCESFGLKLSDLGEAGRKLTKAEILRDLDAGLLPKRVQLDGASPINLEKDESFIWIFNNVTCFTNKTRTQYVGASHGVSIRVVKGVYYRVGAFKGEPVQTQYLSQEGSGDLAITNRNVYFLATTKVLKVPIRKIVAVQGFSDGVQITREGVNPKPQIFKLDDPWFAANAIIRLNKL